MVTDAMGVMLWEGVPRPGPRTINIQRTCRGREVSKGDLEGGAGRWGENKRAVTQKAKTGCF